MLNLICGFCGLHTLDSYNTDIILLLFHTLEASFECGRSTHCCCILTQAEKLNVLMSSFKAIKPHVCHFVWTLKMKCTKMECH